MILSELERLGFPDVLLWLLTFAIIFGVLTQSKMPKSSAARGILAIGIASLVMLSAPAGLIGFISEMSSGLILVVIVLLVLIAFFEAAGVKGEEVYDEKGNKTGRKTIIAQYPTYFGAALVIVAILVFLGAGGWNLLGFQNVTLKGMGSQSMTGIIFLAAVVIGVLWMIMESGKKGA